MPCWDNFWEHHVIASRFSLRGRGCAQGYSAKREQNRMCVFNIYIYILIKTSALINTVNHHTPLILLLSRMQCPIAFRLSQLGSSFATLIISVTLLYIKGMLIFFKSWKKTSEKAYKTLKLPDHCLSLCYLYHRMKLLFSSPHSHVRRFLTAWVAMCTSALRSKA